MTTSETVKCACCGAAAACVGVYEDPAGAPAPACDGCCGHGNEDGWCVSLDSADGRELVAQLGPVATVADLRPVVAAFAMAMERRLRANAGKGPRAAWRRVAPAWLLARACDEFSELVAELAVGAPGADAAAHAGDRVRDAAGLLRTVAALEGGAVAEPARALGEAADAACMLLMFADAVDALGAPDDAAGAPG